MSLHPVLIILHLYFIPLQPIVLSAEMQKLVTHGYGFVIITRIVVMVVMKKIAGVSPFKIDDTWCIQTE